MEEKKSYSKEEKKFLLDTHRRGKAIYKFQWQCASCSKWFKNDKELEVDHISEVGGISEFTGDWNETIARLFPRPVEEHLQLLCILCHQKKTLRYNSARSLYKRKRAP